MRVFILSILFCSFLTRGFAQEMPITGPNISQCEGFLVDNGLSASSYTNNLNESITLCPPAPETIVNLYFGVFALGSGDYMEIFNGSSNSAPLIGTYHNDELQNQDITSSNPSGCLTVHFVSDGAGVGNFGAEISCGPPCIRPTAIITTNQEPDPVLICPGEALTFDASNSTFAPGQSMQSFQWVFDDGTTNTTSWPTVTHTFPGPGGYEVQLHITDNNDCNSANLPDYVVLVSTYPDLSLLSPEFEMCAGGTSYLGVNMMIPDSIYSQDSLNTWITEPWNDLPDIDLGGALFIPDNQSQCFTSEVTYSNFDYDQFITAPGQIDNFFINFEHSYMGDLTITFICPNGQSLAVHQQGGGGTFLGDPVDDDWDLSPGVGYDYYWSPDATNGTWEENGGWGGGSLPSGTYESVQSFNSLVGCPLNGTWSVKVCDMWASDNGYIFDWGINFDPSLFGDLLSFTPTYGQDCDSTYWTGPGIISQDGGCDFIQIELLESGAYPYTFTCTNNFGCTFDTTIIVDIFVAPAVDAGPDVTFSCDPITLQGTLMGETMPYTWHWTPGTGLSDPWIPNPTITNISTTTLYTLTGYPVGNPGCASSDQVLVSIDPNAPNPGIETDISLCPEAAPIDFYDNMDGNPDAGGTWTNEAGTTVGPTFDPAVDPDGTFYYSVTYEDCTVSAPMNIVVEYPQIVSYGDTTVCIGGTATIGAVSPTDYALNYTYHWSNGEQGDEIDISPDSDSTLSVYALDISGCSSDTVDVEILLYDSLQVTTFEDTVICVEGIIELEEVSASGGYGSFAYQWYSNGSLIGSGPSFIYDPSFESTICLRLTDACETPYAEDCFELLFEESMPFTISSDKTAGCVPMDVAFELTTDPSLYTSMSWDFGGSSPVSTPEAEYNYALPGFYDVGVYMISPRGCAYNYVFEDYIQGFNDPVAAWSADPQPTTINDPEIHFTNTSTGPGLTYSWIFDTENPLGTSTLENPTFTFPGNEGGIYNVQLTVVDENGCTDHVEGIVDIDDIFVIYIPNTFTPDNDGINDVFMVMGADIRDTNYELLIFNRWGDLIFESHTPGEPWTGNDRNNSLYYVPDGVYTYVLKAASASTVQEVRLSGFVILTR